MCGRGVPPRLGGRQVNLEEAVMGSATVQGQLLGTGPHDWAEVAETLVRLSYGNLAGADVATADGDVIAASEIDRWDLVRGLRGGGGNFGIGSRFEFTLHPVSAILGGLRNQNIRPAR
jgi:hypothetical protein